MECFDYCPPDVRSFAEHSGLRIRLKTTINIFLVLL